MIVVCALHLGIRAGARAVRHLAGRGDQTTIAAYYLHHTTRMLLALLLILLLARGRVASFGLNLRNTDQSFAVLARGFVPIVSCWVRFSRATCSSPF